MKFKTIILTSLILLFCFINAKSQDCVFTLRTVTTPSTCFANGTVKVIAEGVDVDAGLLSLASAQYKIQELGGQGHSTAFATNNGEFFDLHKGNYTVTIRVFCSKNGITVDKQTATFTISGDYVAPNMYVDLANTVKTMNCIYSGRLALYFNYGKAPYTAKILNAPPEYGSRQTEFTIPTAGLSYIEDLPAGAYNLELKDNCGNTFVTSDTIATLSTDFIDYVVNVATTYLDNCKSLKMSCGAIASTHELYYYSQNFAKYYNIFLQEDDGALVAMPGASKDMSNFYFELNNLTYGDLYPASSTFAKGGNIAKLYFTVKGCNTYSNPVYISVMRPRSSYIQITPVCDGVVLKIGQMGGNSEGVICYPYKAEIKDAATNALISIVENIPNNNIYEIGTVPYGTNFYVVFTGADGGQWTPTMHTANSPLPVYINDKPKAFSTVNIYDVCREDRHTGSISLFLWSTASERSMIPGTQVKSIKVPLGMQHAPDTILTTSDHYFPYGASNIILPGVYKYEVSLPCIGLKDTITVTFGSIDALYKTSNLGNSCAGYLGKMLGYIAIGTLRDVIPGGTTITYTGSTPNTPAHDAAVLHPNFVMPSGISRVFNPFVPDYSSSGYAEIPSGTYEFKIHDAFCNQTKTVSLAMNKAYSLEGFGYTTDTLCDGIKIYPLGQIKVDWYNTNTYFEIVEALNEDGTVMPANEYPTHTISKGEFYTLQRNGIYILAIKNKFATGACASGTLTIHYKQPSPSLNYKLTASFMCKGAALGDSAFIKLVGIGGYSNGPYEYEIIEIKKSGQAGFTPVTGRVNTTGEFTYGEANDVLKIRITDKSPEATAKGCIAAIEQNVTVLDLSEASIAYSENNGNFCEGETIKLNCVSLGNTTYNWTGPNGFTSTDQFPDIPNATLAMSGYYYVNVTPESCGDVMKDSVLITVHPNPTAPNITTINPYACYTTGSYNLVTLTGATANTGNSLKWYDSNGLPLASTSVSSLIIGITTYYVSQVVGATLCEGPRVLITLEVKALPISPIAPSPAPVCYGENFTICITNADAVNKYRLYAEKSVGGIVLDEKQGTASPTLCFDPLPYNVSSAALTRYVATVSQFGCESTPRSVVTTQRAPTSTALNVLINDTTVCRGDSVTLKVTVSGVTNPQITWYETDGNLSTVLKTGDTYTTLPLNSTAYYYIGVKGDGLCETVPANRKRVMVKTDALATSGNITANNVSVCIGNNAILLASTTSVTNPIFTWYADNVSLVPIFVGSTFQYNSVLKDTVFYVSVKGDNLCENLPANRRQVSVTAKGYSKKDISEVHPTFGMSDGSISVDLGHFGGVVKYRFNNIGVWVTVTSLNNPATFSNLAEGNYRFQIDAGGCNDLDTIITLKSKIIALDDVITVFKGTSVIIPISNNDSDPGRTQLRDSILTPPGKGTATLTEPRDGSLVYTNNGQVGIDSLRYVLKSAYESDEAKVTIYIVDKTEIILADSCSFAPYMLLSRTYAGATYAWEFSDDDGATWTDLGIVEAKCPAVNAGWYRVKIRVGNAELITDYKNLVIINKTNLLNKIWYEVGFN